MSQNSEWNNTYFIDALPAAKNVLSFFILTSHFLKFFCGPLVEIAGAI